MHPARRRIIGSLLTVGLLGCGASRESTSRTPTSATAEPSAPSTPCSFALEIGATTFDAAGGTAPATITTGVGCRWTIDAGASPWVRTSPGTFAGSVTTAVAIDPNRSFASRSGALTIRSENHVVADRTIAQRGAGCLYSVDIPELTVDERGSYWPLEEPAIPTDVHVHAEPSECRWTATPAVPWLQLTRFAATSGTGDGRIQVLVAPNTGPSPRTGEVVIAGLSGVNPDARVSVTQTAR